MDIVREYQQQHPRGKDIRIVRQPQNGGLGRARNRIIEEARGRYLYHFDADDAIAPNTIELLLKNNIRHKAVNYWEDFSTTIDLPSYVTRVVMIPDITYFYYCRYGSLSNFSKRNHIDKQEIQKTIDAMALVKQNTDRLKQKPYFHKRMYKVMATHLYMALAIMEQRKVISPPFSMREMRDVMRSPLTFRETIKLKGWWAKNVALYLLGVLPPLLTVGLFWVIYPYFKAVEKRKEKYANVVHAK